MVKLKKADATSKRPEIGLRDGVLAVGAFFSGGFASTKTVNKKDQNRKHNAN